MNDINYYDLLSDYHMLNTVLNVLHISSLLQHWSLITLISPKSHIK